MILTPEGFSRIHSELVVLPFPCFIRVILLMILVEVIFLLIIDAVVLAVVA